MSLGYVEQQLVQDSGRMKGSSVSAAEVLAKSGPQFICILQLQDSSVREIGFLTGPQREGNLIRKEESSKLSKCDVG